MRRPTRIVHVLAVVAAGCSAGGSCGGCGSLEPIPGGSFTGEKQDSALTARLTAGGYDMLNQNWQLILARFAPGQRMDVPLSCMVKNFSLLGDVVIADEGSAGCTAEGCGQMDGKCDALDQPKLIPILFRSMSLSPAAPDQVKVTIDVTIATGKIMIDTKSRNHYLCAFTSPVKCSFDFDTQRATPANNVLEATIQLVIDQRWDRLLSFNVASIGGSQTCGSSGAPAKPACLDPADVVIQAEGSCQTCDVADWGPVKTFLLGQLAGSLKDSLQGAIDDQGCRSCDAGTPCPQTSTASSQCKSGVCIDTQTDRCVPGVLGVEGRLPAGSLFSGLPEDSALDLYLAAGGQAKSDTGTTVGVRGGSLEATPPGCVPTLSPPALAQLAAPDLDADAPGAYDVGLSMSRQYLDQTLHHLHQSGAMCAAITTSSASALTSGLFEPLLPSLGLLSGKDDVPMMVSLRPQQPPKVSVGLGTVDPITGKPLDPLLTVTMKELAVDFYALLDERFARLFTLTFDLRIPLSLTFAGCTDVTPAIGSLEGAVTNVRASNSEILAEDVSALERLVPVFVGMAEPALGNQLGSFALPAFGDFKLEVKSARGVSLVPGTSTYDHLGLYARLLLASTACAVPAPRAKAALRRMEVPPAERILSRDQELPWPQAILEVLAEGGGTPEFSYRVDRGLWTTFRRARAGELEVRHPSFLLQGRHSIEVRARMAERPSGVSAPVPVGVVVDWSPPEVALRLDRAADRIIVEAEDLVTAKEALAYAYRLGEGEWTPYGPARVVVLSAVEAAGGLEVRVRDEAGLIGEARHRPATVATRGPDPEGSIPAQAGCSAAAGLLPWLAIAAVLFRRRSRLSRQARSSARRAEPPVPRRSSGRPTSTPGRRSSRTRPA